MHQIRSLIPFLFLSLFSCADKGPADEVAEVRTTFDQYLQAIVRGEGATAAALVDSNTLAYFDRMLELARTADSVEVSRLEVMDRIMVLGLRIQADRDKLGSMDAREAVAMGSNVGIIGGEEAAALDIGTITVNGDRATAPMKLGGFPVPAKFHFRREAEGWKIDVTSLFTISKMAFDQMALRSGSSSNEWLMEMLQDSDGGRPPDSIWHP